jgi:hypothetical protein
MKKTSQGRLFATEEITHTCERILIVGQPGNPESRGEPEGSIQESDYHPGPKATDGCFRFTELRDDPPRVRRPPIREGGNNAWKFLLREAIQKEVRNNQVIIVVLRCKLPHIAGIELNPFSKNLAHLGHASLCKFDHLRTKVYKVHFHTQVHSKQTSKKAAISSAAQNGSVRRFSLFQKGEPSLL